MTTKAETDVLVGLALDEMDARTIGLSGEALKLELEKFIGEQSVHADGKVTMLWAGYYDVANGIAANDDPNIRVLNKSVANKILESKRFNVKVADYLGVSYEDYIDAERESDIGKAKTEFLFDGEKGLWAQISKRFAQETTGEVRIMTSAPPKNSVLIKTELGVVIEGIVSGRITKVDGFDSADLRDIDRSKLKILEMITLKSMQVCQGALLACSFGTAPASLGVLPTNKVITNSKPAARP